MSRPRAYRWGIALCAVMVFAVLTVRLVSAQTPPAAGAAAPAASPAVPVTLGRAVRRDVPVLTRGIGTVQAYQFVTVRARVDGTLEQIGFTEGQEVKAGDLLAVIDPRPYAAVLAQAQAKQAADQAQLANARLDLVRYANLARVNFASRQQLDTQQATVNQLVATVQADQAAVAAAALNLSFCHVTAPFQGVVGLRQIDIGNLIHATDTQGIVTLAQIHPIALVFTLPQDALPRVRAAMAGGAPPVFAYTSDGGTELSRGSLLTPNNAIDQSTGTISLKAIFQNQDNRLWPGQFVSARLQLGIDRHALTVPPPAIQHGPDGLYVYVARPDHTVARQDVTVGYEDETVAVITSGLGDGAAVVLDGQSRLQDGARIAPRPPGPARS